ncbi:MAG TPA: hypothetical protein PKH69_04520 [Thiobacillaceae bacterium]|nr:hypothetical protein [Thiobacillaceae bacterium]HNU63673.1 hypothetical protein [Thiobacillaceae bacterium]
MQIDNGGGKTSLTEACLYMLTRDRRLRNRVEDRVAPVDKGWTHVRMEFVEKPHAKDILQADLITRDPLEMPGSLYVVGMCWSRTKDPYFYSYQGALDDAPCYTQAPKGLTLIGNEAFRKSVERLPGAKWNRWSNQATWLDEIKQFTNIEVLKQNVEFQMEGAGDYSAMINKVKPEGDETYDTAFFRQFVAPELLRHAMGTEGDSDEDRFEDTILKTLKPAADALLDINRRQRELDDTQEALRQFEPVLEKASEVVSANADYEREMVALAQNAATVQSLVGRTPIPGIPVIPAGTQWASDKRVMAALGHMVIDKKHGAVITDEGLAELIGVETGRVNQYARDKHVETLTSDLQAIELQDVIKRAQGNSEPVSGTHNDSQHIEYKDVIKLQKHGGRRKAVLCYDLESALSLVSATSNLAGAKTSGLSDVLTRAFGIASDEIDTNPYRRHLRKLGLDLSREKKRQKEAETKRQRHQQNYEALINQSREAEENQIAYEGFMARKNEFPKEHWESPVAAHAWAVEEAKRVEGDRTEHVQLSSERKGGYAMWQALTAKHGLTPLPDALAALNDQHDEAEQADKEARRKLDEAKKVLGGKRTDLDRERVNLNNAKNHLDKLQGLTEHMPAFRSIFGDADPMSLDPQAKMRAEQKAQSENARHLQSANAKKQTFLDLLPKTQLFVEIFGEVAPDKLDPSTDLRNHLQAISAEEGIVTEHQPLVNALSLFQEQHPGANIEEWLWRTAERRRTLTEERANNNRSVNDLNGELDDLRAFGAADDRVYSRALKLLAEHGIAFERLHDLAATTVRETRLEQCLTLFSAFLSAPVVDSVEMATEAAKLLEEARLTVPIFLRPALEAFLLEGDVRQVGDVAHGLWVGRHTRQVAVLLNPSLVEEEKERIEGEIKVFTERNEEIERLLEDISEESDAVKTALDAKEAIRRDSERIHAEATEKLDNLRAKTSTFERRASTEAQEAISAMKCFLQAGGDSGYQELTETVIPSLEGIRDQIGERLEILSPQTTEPALRALHAAKDFRLAGGEEALAAAEMGFNRLDGLVETLGEIVEELQNALNGELAETSRNAAEALRLINEIYALEKRDLENAIGFENQGFVAFMETAGTRMEELGKALEAAQKRLQGIDFDRADCYLQSTHSDERSLSERIAEEQENRDHANDAALAAGKEITRIDGEMAFMAPHMEAMHEMVAAIRVQYAKVAMFSEDIRRLAQASSVIDPEILEDAEIIRSACTGEIPGIDPAVRTAMLNLGQSVSELEIDTAGLQRLAGDRRRLNEEFIQRRDVFCVRARKGEIKGLNQLEISIISEAKTIEELHRIQDTRDSIQAQIDEISANLSKLRETMEDNKEASIENLAGLARQADMSLKIMERVMKRTPNARFHVEAPVADKEEIKLIINDLLGKIEDKERAIRERGVTRLNDEIAREAADYKKLIHDTIYSQIFTGRDKDKNPVVPRVYFTHASIRGTDMVPYSDKAGLSTGQKTALAMMWLIKQAEFAIARAAALYSSRKEQKAALQGAQRVMFFDGLFSNLSNEDYINDAFQGLGGAGENFQLIGLIHNPYYVNNKDIFPVHLIGRKKVATGGEPKRRHVFVSVEPHDDNGMILFTSAYKHARINAPEAADA